MYTLDIIIPCYNEEKAIKKLYEKLIDILYTLDDIDSRFIFINDGSSDKTLSVIKDIVKTDKRCVYVSFSRNFGKEAAILAGMKFSNADFACIIDADLQHPPELIPKMLEALIDEDYDVAAARRSDRKEAKFTDKLSEKFYQLLNKISSIELEQNAQDFRIMKRKVVNAYLCVHEYNRFSRGLFNWVGYKTKWFEHEDADRVAGESKWNAWSLIKYAITAITSFSTLPLRVPTFAGTSLLLVWFIKFIYCLSLSISQHSLYFSNCLLLFIGGLILLSIGIFGEYLSVILVEVKHRPDFIITETNVLFDEHARSNYTFDVVDVYEDSPSKFTNSNHKNSSESKPVQETKQETVYSNDKDDIVEIDESDLHDISQEAFNYYED